MAAPTRPTRETLISRIMGDISARTEGSAFIERSLEAILAVVLGGLADGFYGHLDWLRKQISPLTCGIDLLLVWGALVHVPRNGKTEATGTVNFPAADGAVVPLDTQIRSVTGAYYKATSVGVASAGSVTFSVIALEAGSAGNLGPGVRVQLVYPVPGVVAQGNVSGASGLSGGTEVEDVEPFRARVLEALRKPPKGGGPGDYVKWAKENAGVTRAWEYGRRMGAGTVSLAFVLDGREDIFPTADDLAAVTAYIAARAPIDLRDLYVQPPSPVPVDAVIALRPNTLEVRLAVLANLKALFAAAEHERPIPESDFREAVSTAEGEIASDLVSISSLDPGPWGLLKLGSIVFVPLA